MTKKHRQAIKEWFAYTWEKKKGILIASVIVTFMILKVTSDNNQFKPGGNWLLDNWWGQFFDPVIGLWTFFIALFIWAETSRRDYIVDLPKRLSVTFFMGNHPLFYCHKASLSGESDIRQMGQSVGQQANSGRLDFTPFFKIENEVEYDILTKRNINHYRLEMYLNSEPEGITKKMQEMGGKHEKDTYILFAADEGKKSEEMCVCLLEDPELNKIVDPKLKSEILSVLGHTHT